MIMKDSTKHIVAKEIAFFTKLFLIGVIITCLIIIISNNNPLIYYFKYFSDSLIITLLPVLIGYIWRLYIWVKKWK